jgi:hypothetical protein
MYFIAVIYSFFRSFIFTALPDGFIITTRRKYGDVIFRSIRQLEKLTIKLQKCKCDIEFLRFCLLYDLTPSFVNITLWKKRLKTQQECLLFKRHLLQEEYHNRNKDALKHEKLKNELINNLQSSVSSTDYINIQKFMYELAMREREKIKKLHMEKLERLNKGPVGQNYESVTNKLIHNISSYVLSSAEERLQIRLNLKQIWKLTHLD